MATSTMSLKLLIDTKQNKVVFAEAGKDFVDFLHHRFALPFGIVISHLKKSAMAGCIANLCESLASVQSQVSNLPLLHSDTNQVLPEKTKLYYCTCHPGYVTDTLNNKCCQCCCRMSTEVQFVGTNNAPDATTDKPTSSEAGYVKGLFIYMVTDDLTVSPLSMVSGLGLLKNLNINNFSVLEEKVIKFGNEKVVELLEASLLSKDALTSVFLSKQKGGGGAPSNKR